MLARFDSEPFFSNREVTEFVCPQHVVCLESGIEAFFRPDSSNTLCSIEDNDFRRRIDLEIGLCVDQSMPSYGIIS
jgi:hypothetical protein